MSQYITRTVVATDDAPHTERKAHLSQEDLDELEITDGDEVILKCNHDTDPELTLCVGVEKTDEGELGDSNGEKESVGLEFILRFALGAPEGESISISTVGERPKPSDITSLLVHKIRPVFSKLFKTRPVICRTKRAIHMDTGFRVCRITEENMDLLGVEKGDKLVLQTPYAPPKSVKVLPLSERLRGIKEVQEKKNENRYPNCVKNYNTGAITGAPIDISSIHIDRDIRNDLWMDKFEDLNEGLCQPISVYRDPITTTLRVCNDVAIPVVLGLLGLIFVLRDANWLVPEFYVSLIVGLGIIIIILSILYRVRSRV